MSDVREAAALIRESVNATYTDASEGTSGYLVPDQIRADILAALAVLVEHAERALADDNYAGYGELLEAAEARVVELAAIAKRYRLLVIPDAADSEEWGAAEELDAALAAVSERAIGEGARRAITEHGEALERLADEDGSTYTADFGQSVTFPAGAERTQG